MNITPQDVALDALTHLRRTIETGNEPWEDYGTAAEREDAERFEADGRQYTEALRAAELWITSELEAGRSWGSLCDGEVHDGWGCVLASGHGGPCASAA